MENSSKNENYIFLKGLIKVSISGVLLAFLINRIILPTRVAVDSMGPTLSDGRYVLVNKINKDLVNTDNEDEKLREDIKYHIKVYDWNIGYK